MALLTSRLKMDGNWAPHHVALMDGLAARRFQLRDRLEQGGCSPALFDNASELLALLCGGKRFDLMLIVEDGTAGMAPTGDGVRRARHTGPCAR
jgi:hypothetical protein